MNVRILASLSNHDGYWHFNENGLFSMKFGFIKWVDKGRITSVKDLEG